METWLPVVGYEGYYEVSDQGNVRSLRSGKLRKPYRINGGYLTLLLSGAPGTKKGSRYVAHLVIDAFYEVRKRGTGANDWQVNHIDGNKLNNRLENLEYVTHRENHIHAAHTGLAAHGEHNGAAKLTAQQVIEIMKLRGAGIKRRPIAEQFGVTVSAIQSIDNGGWRHLRQ